MPTFTADDGTVLAYHVIGEGSPVVCLPGGPSDSAYLGDFGGLSQHRQLIRLDLRGTGESAMPDDIATCRCDRMVNDVEALREHLGVDTIDLLVHCAGANIAAQYVATHEDRVSRLALVTPSIRAVGIDITGEDRLATARLRRDESWFPDAYSALEVIVAGQAGPAEWTAIDPFSYGRWDRAAQAHVAMQNEQTNPEVASAFGADGAFDPDVTRAALQHFESRTLLLAGEVDVGAPPSAVGEYAGLFPNAELVVQPGAGHFPWLDDADQFIEAVATFLDEAATAAS